MDASQAQFESALLSMDRLLGRSLLEAAASEGRGVMGMERLIGPVLGRIGDRWEAGDLSLTQVYMAGRICEDLLTDLCGSAATARGGPRIAVGVLLDHHQLGKRIVIAALRSGGFEVLDYGHGQGPEDLAARALRDQVAILMVSTLMLSSALQVKTLRQALGEGPDRPRLVVGGAPFRLEEGLWREVGADATGRSGLDAVTIAQRILEESCAR